MANIFAISVSSQKGTRKKNIEQARLLAGFGLQGDGHGGDWHRQVSLLAQESIDAMRAKGLDVVAGNFAENITTHGIDLTALAVGVRLRIGGCELVVSQLGKVCHHRCAIYYQAGDCVMPREGIFAVVATGGTIRVGDDVEILAGSRPSGAIVAPAEQHHDDIQRLAAAMATEFSPALIRRELLSPANHSSLPAILDDLLNRQRLTKVIVYDPAGSLGLHLGPWHPSATDRLDYRRAL